MIAETPDPFPAALEVLLLPQAQLMVARGIPLQTAVEALKRALVAAVQMVDDDEVPDSRVALRTGLHRKDVRRLRAEGRKDDVRRKTTVAAQVLSHWAAAPDFLGPDGRPRELTRSSRSATPGFDDLVRRVRADMAPGTVLAMLIESGSVAENADGLLRLQEQALIPEPGSEALVAAYRATLTPHLTAATHNLLAGQGEVRHFDRVVRYSHLSSASVAELSELARARAEAMLIELNARAHALQRADEGKNPGGRFAAGAYLLSSRAQEDDDA